MDDENESVTSMQTSGSQSKKTGKDETWKSYHKDLVKKMLLERVRDATAARNKARLEEYVNECGENDLAEHKDVKKANFVLNVITHRENLSEAVEKETIKDIQDAIKDIESHRSIQLQRELQQDIIDARRKIDQKKRKKPNELILAMDKKTMSEMRRYGKPPQLIKRIMQAVLLLLGVDEYTSENWGYCLRMLNPHGRDGMSRKIMELEPSQIDPEIWATSKHILSHKDMTLSKIKAVSSAAATFYVWAMGIIDECEQISSSEEEPRPASVQRQQEILKQHSKQLTNAPQLSPYAKRKYPVIRSRYLEKSGSTNYRSDVGVIPNENTDNQDDAPIIVYDSEEL